MNQLGVLMMAINASRRRARTPPTVDIFKRTLPELVDRRAYFGELIKYLKGRGVGINVMKRMFNCHKSEIKRILETIE